ncbi:putative phenol acid carboxylase, partial [Aureobasidium melanogenum]
MSRDQKLPAFLTNTPLHPSFDTDIKDVHLVYDYDAQSADGTPEKWRYEAYFESSTRVNYKIHGGPMNGRVNYQTATFQCIRPGALWQVNWLEETGTVCSLVYDIENAKITTMISFSKGHWQHPEVAHGDKRDPETFEKWRALAKEGTQIERYMISEQADILETYRGIGDLVPIEEGAETI